MKKARIGVRVLPLLSGKIHVTEININGLSVLLVENEKGGVNWSFATADAPAKKAPPESTPAAQEKELELQSDSLVLADLVLEDISVDYRSPGLKEPLQFKIEECKGAMTPGKPFTLALKGMLLKEPYNTTVEIGSLKELLEENRFRMEIKTDIAKTRFELSETVNLAQVAKSLKLNASVAGDRLDSLNGLLNLDLPPLKSYRAAAQLTLQKKLTDLSKFSIQVGQSQLTGKMTVDNSGAILKSNIELDSPLIQLNDFDTGDWSPQQSASAKPVSEGDQKKDSSAAGEYDGSTGNTRTCRN